MPIEDLQAAQEQYEHAESIYPVPEAHRQSMPIDDFCRHRGGLPASLGTPLGHAGKPRVRDCGAILHLHQARIPRRTPSRTMVGMNACPAEVGRALVLRGAYATQRVACRRRAAPRNTLRCLLLGTPIDRSFA